MKNELTYDIYFHDSKNSNNKGFRMTWQEMNHYIATADRTSSYWADYIGGVYEIICNETSEVIYTGNI